MALRNPKLETFGNLHKLEDFSGGMYTVRPQDMIPDNASPHTKNCIYDKNFCLSKIWGTNELIAISSGGYNRFINASDYVYGLYNFVAPSGKSRLIIQGRDANDGYMSLYALDTQTSYPATLTADPTRILGASGELTNYQRCTFATYKGRLYVWNGADYLRYWNGTSWRSYHTDKSERFKYIMTYGRRLWAASSGLNPSRVIWTDLNHCNFARYYASGTNYVDFNSPFDYSKITWITQFKNRLLVFKQNSIYAFYGDPDTHGISFDIIAHNVGALDGWSVQVHNDRVYFMARDGIYVYGDTDVLASPEDRRLSAEPNVIRISTEIDDWWEDNCTLPDPEKAKETTLGGYEDFCSTLAFTAGGDASNFKANDVGIEENDIIVGATSKARARVIYVDKTSGTWAGGDAAGTLYLSDVYSYLAFDSGGSADSDEIKQGMKITGATSTATAYVYSVRVTSGAWSTENAAGYLLIQLVDGIFQNNEHINTDLESNIADVDGTIGTWTATEKINLGSKEYATAGTFTQKFRLCNTRTNIAPNTENPVVINGAIHRDALPHTSEQSQTSQDSWLSVRSTGGATAYYGQTFKLADSSPVDWSICSGVGLYLKEIGDVSGLTFKVHICNDDDGEPDFDGVFAEGKLTGNFLHGLSVIGFDSGSYEPNIGDTIEENGGDASAVVHKVVLTSGKWDNNTAAGYFYIKSSTGTWTNDAQIDINGGTADIATVDGTASSISAGCWVFVEMSYWDYAQNMYLGKNIGQGDTPPTIHIDVKVTGDTDANYLQWGYYADSDNYANGAMVNSGISYDYDYAFNVYCRGFYYEDSIFVETNTIDGGSGHVLWKSINFLFNNDRLGDQVAGWELSTIEYLTKSTDTGWTNAGAWDTASTTTNGSSFGTTANPATNQYVRFRLTFKQPYGSLYYKMDTFTLQNILAASTIETTATGFVSSAIHEDRYVLSIKSIADPEVVPS
uniref:Uncharacterized protein n=1 Tax=viral metagenome TaxID=1070528 RepID=A0A6M3XKK4_9ZZZZ